MSPPGSSIEDEHIQETPVDGFEIVQMEFPHLGFFLAFKGLLPVEISIVLGEGGMASQKSMSDNSVGSCVQTLGLPEKESHAVAVSLVKQRRVR